MPDSHTVVAALKFQGGVVIGADSQVTDIAVSVRWPMDKLEKIGNHPLVVGFSGSGGMGVRAREALQKASFGTASFRRKEGVRTVLDGALQPVYKAIQDNSKPPTAGFHEIALLGVAAFYAGGEPHILEREFNCDSFFHTSFHAIGSGGQTAYAVYRTLGGTELCKLQEGKAKLALIRILRTAIRVDAMGVSEPLSLFVVSEKGAREVQQDEIQPDSLAVAKWEERDRQRFFNDEI